MSESAALDDGGRRQEVAVVGGGPAGLSAALTLGRARVDAVVVDAGRPRGAATARTHGLLSRDGIASAELDEAARRDLDRYDSVDHLTGEVTAAARLPDGFGLRLAGGDELQAERLLLAVGRSEAIGDLGIPGLEAVYGSSVFPCPFCDGWEVRDRPLAVFGAGEEGLKLARVATRWSGDVVLFTGGQAVEPEDRARLERLGVGLEERPVTRLADDEGELRAVELADGGSVERSAGFVATAAVERSSELLAAIGVPLDDHGLPEVDGVGRTPVAGVYVAGDARRGFAAVPAAVGDGSMAAKAIVADMVGEQWDPAGLTGA